jgi:hypothetical protein
MVLKSDLIPFIWVYLPAPENIVNLLLQWENGK